MPLIDAGGSAIALVNTAQPGALASTLTSDPYGMPTIAGGVSWPFQWHGLEHEPTDPIPLFFNPSGNVYNPKIQHYLSLLGQQGLGGPGSGFGGASAGAGNGNSSSVSAAQAGEQVGIAVGAGVAAGAVNTGLAAAFALDVGAGSAFGPVGIAVGALTALGEFLADLFGGGGSPEILRQLKHGPHPAYGDIIGISKDLLPTEAQAKCDCPDAPVLPDGKTVAENIALTKSTIQRQGLGAGRIWWGNKVRPGGDWDYKRYPGGWEKWDYAGNFNYGATGRACNLSASTLENAGARLQSWNDTWHGGANSKAALIRAGERYYDCGCYNG